MLACSGASSWSNPQNPESQAAPGIFLGGEDDGGVTVLENSFEKQQTPLLGRIAIKILESRGVARTGDGDCISTFSPRCGGGVIRRCRTV